MKTYKVVKIWYIDADNGNNALTNVVEKDPDFVSVNDKFRVGKNRLRKTKVISS